MNSVHSQPDRTSSGLVSLPASATTVCANDLRVHLVTAFDGNEAVEIDASEVETVGQAVLQLLMAAQEEAKRAETVCRVVNPSAAFAERVNECGLAERIGMNSQEGTEI